MSKLFILLYVRQTKNIDVCVLLNFKTYIKYCANAITVAVICNSFNSNAQVSLNPNKLPDQYNFEHWTSDDGLPDNAIIKVIQSKNGYIWFCSYGGVTRFNGAEFFTYSSYNSPEIVNNSFTNIYEDHNGLIWAATSGNGAILIEKDTITAYTVESGLPSNFVEAFVEDKNGRLWVATSEGISYKEGDHFVNEGIPDKLKRQNVVSIDCDENNHTGIATKDDGVIQYTGKTTQHYNSETALIYDRINNIRRQKRTVYVDTPQRSNINRN